ncbi:MAG TPA: dihydroxyacetone kinase subunit DhaL [Devosia sp.]|nr:dihydroxyacetone kinase subunit DhaL [Devosia sp.]
MSVSAETLGALIDAVTADLIAHADELTALDSAIGDADHGINMKRGAEAIRAERDALVQKPLPDALKAIGTKLVMTVGGASGPLYGTLAMSLAKELPAVSFAEAFGKAADAVAARGKSQIGQKTMLDVLYPLADAVKSGTPVGELPAVAQRAAEETIPLKAIRGRASFLGDRSIGHMDPGSRSVSLITAAIVRTLENAS